ncbi:hypothetical protein KEU06_22575 [Pseudaminobacter sp. 19-2017]|uniref:Uncharacterized protein n=1 Tax=Pseudaminobacter soli (ex Zhang et al. 2022) TaxID=2831468 RepID=A0A942E6I0_9HYPH|nr:hypothetical protein [Pseudaminobacter soli]MBS3651405.1 hypothetical protein [Pseudaminobacter soli]
MRFAGAVMAVVCAAIQLLGATAALAADRWKIGRGEGAATATTYSINTLSTTARTIEYRAALVISCKASRYPVWRASILIRRAISGQGGIPVTMRYDNGVPFEDVWTLGDYNRSLNMDGEQALARLARARRFDLSWRFGLFSGEGQAVFDVAGLDDAIADLAKACGVSVPVGTPGTQRERKPNS